MFYLQKQPRVGNGNDIGDSRIFENLDDEYVVEILRRLPANQLWWSCRGVCKTWNALMSSPYFRQLHLQQPSPSTFLVFARPDWPNSIKEKEKVDFVFPRDHDSKASVFMKRDFNGSLLEHWKHQMPAQIVHLFASSNGLVLFWNDISSEFYIGNPITGELLTMRSPYYACQLCGFFYHSSMQEYKLLYYRKIRNGFEYLILTLGSTRWRTLRVLPYRPVSDESPVMLDNTLYWMTSHPHSACENFSIMMFFLDNEEFCTMSHPSFPCPNGDCHRYINLLDMEGKLTCWGWFNLGVFVRVLEVVDSDNHQIQGHWTQIYTLDFDQTFKSYFSLQDHLVLELVGFQNRELVLLLRKKEAFCQNISTLGVFLYNLSTNTVEKIELEGLNPFFSQAILQLTRYTKSLVPLNNFNLSSRKLHVDS